MANPQILNLNNDVVIRRRDTPVLLDEGGDLQLVGGGARFKNLVLFTERGEGDRFGIQETDSIKLPGGLNAGEDITDGTSVIGTIEEIDDFGGLRITFSPTVTNAQVENLLKALTFISGAAEEGFTENPGILLELYDIDGGMANVSLFVGDEVIGTDDDETFEGNADDLNDGDSLNGGGGDDTFQLANGDRFDLSEMHITNIETIRGSDNSDLISLSARHLKSTLKSIDAGLGVEDVLALHADAYNEFDLMNIDVTGFEEISVNSSNSTILLDDIDLAMIVTGKSARNDTLVMKAGISLSEDERLAIHRKGIDTIVAGGKTTTHTVKVAGLHGDVVSASVGTRTFLDAGRNALLHADSGLLESIFVTIIGGHHMSELIQVQEIGGVTLQSTSDPNENLIKVDGTVIGTASGGSAHLHIRFIALEATTARVQKVIQALTYTATSNSLPGMRTVKITVKDVGGRETTSDVSVMTSVAPTDIGLSNASVRELADTGETIGTLSATDTPGSSFTYEIKRSDGSWGSATSDGRFKVEGNQLKVANGLLLDYEQAKSHDITIKVTDNTGLSYEKTFTIGLTDVAGEVITGTDGNDSFVGGVGMDIMRGGAGNDTLNGGLGNDRLYGGTGKDVFVFDTKPNKRTNKDKILDWKYRDDTIHLDKDFFKKLPKGKLKSKYFTLGDKAKDKNDYIGVNKKTGDVWYDTNGDKAGGQTIFANIGKKKAIFASDFFVI